MISKATLASFVVKAMMSWISISAQKDATSETMSARYQALADDYVEVARSEPPLFASDPEHAKTVLLLASIESFESAFKKNAVGDGGRSYCEAQIQPGPTGIVLDAQEWHYAGKNEMGIKGAELLSNHATCARVALHMLRVSLRRTHSLRGYTGEGKDAPKAKHRLERAERWYETHKTELIEGIN